MSLLRLRDIIVEAGGRRILDVDHLEVRDGEVLAILGPTGAGKSTLLRVAALLQEPVRGSLRWRGEELRWPAPLAVRRRITMAFQDPLLFSGTTLDNVLYGLSVRGVSGHAARERAMAMLEKLRIEARAEQAAHTLSGGEAHRAALARALVFEPELLLLDEPLASLDEPIRQELGEELLAIIRKKGLTTVLVTHDQGEARALADRIAILEQGRVRQVGTPGEVFTRPADAFVARFVGTANAVSGRVVALGDGLVEVAVGRQRLFACSELAVGRSVSVCFRPEEVTLARNPPSEPHDAKNLLCATVTGLSDQTAAVTVRLECGFPLVALLPRPVARELKPKVGEQLLAAVPPTVVHLIEESR